MGVIALTLPRSMGWSGGAMVLGKLPVPGRLLIWMIVEQGPIALAVGAGGGCLDIVSRVYQFSFLSPSLWETARYRLKYCLKRSLSPNQPTNQCPDQPIFLSSCSVSLLCPVPAQPPPPPPAPPPIPHTKNA